jgi:hypothetical protein
VFGQHRCEATRDSVNVVSRIDFHRLLVTAGSDAGRP